jgi:hypothetical protein
MLGHDYFQKKYIEQKGHIHYLSCYYDYCSSVSKLRVEMNVLSFFVTIFLKLDPQME